MVRQRSELLIVLALLCAAPALAQVATERVFDARNGFGAGWTDVGWAQREISPGAPARIDFSGKAGWIVARPGFRRHFQMLTFLLRAPRKFGDFLDVRLESAQTSFPRVRVSAANRRELREGWSEVTLPMRELNPKNLPFEQIVFQAAEEVPNERVEIDAIGLAGVPQRQARLTIDCGARGHPISPLIYGIAHGDEGWWNTGAPTRRWGGNPNTRYNWDHGNAWNLSKDWFYKNVDYSRGSKKPAWEIFLEQNAAHRVSSAITVPMIGWVAKDTTSYSFPVSVFGPQQAVAPENPDMGNGIRPDGRPIPPGPPTRTSVAASPEFVERWVRAIRGRDKGRGVQMYILDNEPTLWDSTHRDVHPNPVSYEELLDRTVKYAAAVRAADPDAEIAGFVAWGWTALFYSAMDMAGSSGLRVDRTTHGNMPLLPWWLQNVRKQESRTGTKLVDVLDVHYYPQTPGMGVGTGGETDDATAAARIRAPRSLWDPAFRDESWIGEEVRLIPRLREWIDQYAPGMKISIGEYNFGAEEHMSGGLAVAEALGHFGSEGIHSAYYWTSPKAGSPAFWAFRAFRNFDGKGGRFLDESVAARSSDPLTAVFASRDGRGRAVLVLLNEAPDESASVAIELGSCGKLREAHTFRYGGAPSGFEAVPATGKPTLPDLLPPYSLTVVDLRLAK